MNAVELQQRFVNEGYVIVPEVLSAAEVEALRVDAVKLARGGYPSEQLKPLPADLSDDQVLRQLLCIHQPHFLSPVMAQYMRHPGICTVLHAVVGAHLAHWDGRVKCMQSMLFIKGPGDPGQAWHQDEIYIPTRDRSLCGAWLALDDATVTNGCLWVIPGSHCTGYLYPQRPHDNPDEFDFAPESHGFDAAAEVPVEVAAGSAVFFNGYLLHRSRKNRSQGYRRALVYHYMNTWSRLPWWLEEGESVAAADRRNVVSVCGEDPYAWKGTAPPGDVWLRPRKRTP